MASIIASLQACLTLKCILAWAIVGIVVGIGAWVIREVASDGSYSLVAHLIIGIVFAFLGLAASALKFELLSIPAVAISVLISAFGEVIVGSALAPKV